MTSYARYLLVNLMKTHVWSKDYLHCYHRYSPQLTLIFFSLIIFLADIDFLLLCLFSLLYKVERHLSISPKTLFVIASCKTNLVYYSMILSFYTSFTNSCISCHYAMGPEILLFQWQSGAFHFPTLFPNLQLFVYLCSRIWAAYNSLLYGFQQREFYHLKSRIVFLTICYFLYESFKVFLI